MVPDSDLVDLKSQLLRLPAEPSIGQNVILFKDSINRFGWHKMPLFCRHEAALVALMSISVGKFVPIK